MAKFRYGMQNILNVKEKLEDQAKNDFALAAAKVNEEEAKLDALEKRKEGYESELKELCGKQLDIARIKETEDAIEIIKYHIQMQKLAVAAANQKLDVARSRLTVAVQERKTHDKLKEKQFEAFKAEEAAKESKEIDEFVSFRHTHSE